MSIQFRPVFILGALIFAGEIIFGLPFHIARFFRPTLLSAFEINNAQLGDAFAIYGITAMLSYFPGGVLADRFSPRNLLVFSLLATAAGGLYFATFPSGIGLKLVFGWWGMTTIFLFWAAMIKATRHWGGEHNQGRAFGFLDGGRGLVAAGAAAVAVVLLNQSTGDAGLRSDSLRSVIYFYTGATCLAAIFIWLVLPGTREPGESTAQSWQAVLQVLRDSRVWPQAGIVICAYCGYKGLDYFPLYAVDVLQMPRSEAEQLAANAAWLRPVAAIAAGFLADRFAASRIILTGFLSLVISYGFLAYALPVTWGLNIIYANLIVSFLAVFAIRGVYFALLQESRLDKQVTGTAVGVISVVGFTPDIFFAPIAGRLIDASPGAAGHHDFYGLLLGIAIAGSIMTLFLMRRIAANKRP